MTPNTPTPAATAPAGQVHTATQAAPADIARERFRALVHAHGDRNFECGECDGSPEERDDLCRSAGVALNRVMDAHSQLLAQNAALTARCEELTKEWRDLASTDNAKYYAPINSDYERGYGDGIGFAKAYARRVLRDIADAALSRCSP